MRKYKVNVNYQISLLNIRFNCYKKMEDLERAMQVKHEAEVLVSSFTKASRQKTGHDLQTFSHLAKIKCLDSRKRNFSAVKKIEDVRLPSWLMVKEDDFSLIGEIYSRLIHTEALMCRNAQLFLETKEIPEEKKRRDRIWETYEEVCRFMRYYHGLAKKTERNLE